MIFTARYENNPKTTQNQNWIYGQTLQCHSEIFSKLSIDWPPLFNSRKWNISILFLLAAAQILSTCT